MDLTATKIIKIIEKRVGYSFRDKNLIKLAFTHKSADHDSNYERLEFLGDAVVGCVVSEYLYLSFDSLSEGELSKKRASIVSLDSLYKLATILDIDDFIVTEGIEEKNKRIIGNVYESLIGAIFLDSSYDEAKQIVLNHLNFLGSSASNISREAENINSVDYKSTLQEKIQKQYNIVPKYATIKKEGPDHLSIFTVCVKVGDDILGYGTGNSKKLAEQIAAKEAFLTIDKIKNNDKKKR